MKALFYLVLAVLFTGCSLSNGETDPIRDKFYAEQHRLMESHKDLLVNSGHMSKDFGMIEFYLGVYDWHVGSHGYFGAYSFSQAAFEQAKKAWFGHFTVVEGSDELWSNGLGDGLRFDSSVIGMSIPSMSMTWVENGAFKYGRFDAKIVSIKDDGRTLVLDRRAPHYAEQFNAAIKPDDWQNLCACTVGDITEHTLQQLVTGHK